MKILYILDSFPKLSETFILNEIVEVQNKGVDVEVFAFSKPNETISHPNVSLVKRVVYYQKKINLLKWHFHFLRYHFLNYFKTLLFSLNRDNQVLKLFITKIDFVFLIGEAKPNHIHAHFGRQASDMAMLVNLLYGIPFTFTTHRYDIFDYPPRNYKIKSRLAKKHITISKFNKRYIIDKFHVADDNITVIHCGVDFNRRFPKHQLNSKNIILCVARLEKLKGIDVLIKTCNELRMKRVDFECLILGDGSERTNLESLIKHYSLIQRVKLLGYKTQDEVFDLLSNACIQVLASRSEGIPVALMESMAIKVPVIGPKIHGVPELIEDGVNGFLVEPENVDKFTDRIDVLLKNAELRMQFGENGYRKVEKEFNLQTEVEKLYRIWNS